MRKLLWIIVIIFWLTSLLPGKILAADLEVVCQSTGCSPTSFPAFFLSSEIWYPGKSVTKTVKVTNNSTIVRAVKVRAQNPVTTGEIDKVMFMVINQVGQAGSLWQGTLNTFYSAGDLFLADVPISIVADFNFIVTMDLSAGNQYQGKSTSFNMIFSFNQSPNFPTLTPTQTPLPSVTPTSTPEPTVSASSIPTNTPVPQPSATSAPGPTSTPGPGPTSTPGPAPTSIPVPAAPTAFVFGGPFTSIVAPIEYLPTDLLGTQSAAPTGPPGEILGAGEQPALRVRNCQNNWWILVLLLEAISTATVVRFARKDRTSRFLFIQSLSTTICLFVLAQFFCLWWSILLAGCLGILGIILIYLKDFTPLG